MTLIRKEVAKRNKGTGAAGFRSGSGSQQAPLGGGAEADASWLRCCQAHQLSESLQMAQTVLPMQLMHGGHDRQGGKRCPRSDVAGSVHIFRAV